MPGDTVRINNRISGHRTLCAYWDRIRMIDRVCGHYRAELQGFWRVTQGNPLPPTIFNVVVDAVVHHWILLVARGAVGQDGWGREVLHCATFLYDDDSLVASTDPVWLQGAFDTLSGLFNRVGLHTNAGKTVGMLYFPCCTVGIQLEASYRRRMTGEELTHRARMQLRFWFPDCGMDLAAGSLVVHRQTQYGVVMGVTEGDQWETPLTVDDPQMYQTYFPSAAGTQD